MPRKAKDLGNIIGLRFHKLIIINNECKFNKYSHRYVYCKCDCGNEKWLEYNGIILNRTKACGCEKKLSGAKNSKKNIIHGESHNNKTRLYTIWLGMKERCNPKNITKYKNYAGKGIEICKEWHHYQNFKKWSIENGYNDNLTIDRINNNSGYYPENCRWTTTSIQNHNRKYKNTASKYKGVSKSSKNRWKASITHNGKSYHLGSFKTEEEAAIAYDNKAKKLFGNDAGLNNPIGLPLFRNTNAN